jgi:hypothetical protein
LESESNQQSIGTNIGDCTSLSGQKTILNQKRRDKADVDPG